MNRQEAACASVAACTPARPARLRWRAFSPRSMRCWRPQMFRPPSAEGGRRSIPVPPPKTSPGPTSRPRRRRQICRRWGKGRETRAEEKKEAAKPKDPHAWRSMFDGKTLKALGKVPKFGGDGEVKVVDGAISIGMGDGVTESRIRASCLRSTTSSAWKAGDDGNRLLRHHDFPGTTRTRAASWWAVGPPWSGLSRVDYYDASDNITTKYVVQRQAVVPDSHPRQPAADRGLIDQEKVVDLATKGHTRFNSR